MPNPDPMNNMTNLTDQDLIELQWMAARYAHERMTFSADIVNSITLRMIESGIYPTPDRVRGDETTGPTVWVKDGSFGWPTQHIEKHGWDGRKLRREQEVKP